MLAKGREGVELYRRANLAVLMKRTASSSFQICMLWWDWMNAMKTYVAPTEQLVTEIVVRDIQRSTAFYRRLSFTLLRDGGDFVELTWEDHRLFLARMSAFDGVEDFEL